MTRIFTSLALLNTVALLATYLVGVVSKLHDGVHLPTAVNRPSTKWIR